MSPKIKPVIILIVSWILVWFLVFFLSSCSVEKQINRHLKQSARQYKKAISKGYEPRADTIYIKDTVITTEVRHDTTIINKVGDTVIIEKERLKLKYIQLKDSIFIEAECLADTIYRDIPVSVQETIFPEKKFLDYLGINTWWKKALLGLFLLLIAVLFLWRLIK